MPRGKLWRPVTTAEKRLERVEELDMQEPGEPPEETEDERENSEKLADFQAKFSGKQYRIRLERFNVDESEWEWVTRMPLEGFEPFNVLPKYGTGRYKAVLLDEGGRYVRGGYMEFRFMAPAETQAEKSRSVMEDPAVIMVVEQMKQQSTMLMEILKSMIPSQASAAQARSMDPSQMLDMMTKFSALTQNKDTGVKTLTDMMGLMAKAKEAFTPDEPESGGLVSDIKEAIGALALLPQMRSALPAPNSGSNGSPSPGVSGNQRIILPPGTPVMMNPPKTKTPVSPPTPPPSEATQKILFYLPKFEEAGRENRDAQKWAEKLLDILDDEVIPALVKEYNGFVSEDSIYDRLIKAGSSPEEKEKIFIYAPSLLPYKDWVYQVIEEALKIVNEPDNALEESAETPADAL
jgi:hypothetical protein